MGCGRVNNETTTEGTGDTEVFYDWDEALTDVHSFQTEVEREPVH